MMGPGSEEGGEANGELDVSFLQMLLLLAVL